MWVRLPPKAPLVFVSKNPRNRNLSAAKPLNFHLSTCIAAMCAEMILLYIALIAASCFLLETQLWSTEVELDARKTKKNIKQNEWASEIAQ